MPIIKKPVIFMLIASGFILLLILIMQGLEVFHFKEYIDVLFPNGKIAIQQRNLLLVIQAIMLLVIIPVYILTFIFSWIYRADNRKATYDPDLVDNTVAEYIWWGIPLILTLIIGAITWVKTYELDPYKPIVSENQEKTIQVVALQWNWLFIYPEENIASLNFLQIPQDTPIHFEITADAPMNSFWIPDLGGQIYAMPKMKTELYLIANAAGDFRGSSANLSGEGFAGMKFITRASSKEDFEKWVESVKKSPNSLSVDEYEKIAIPKGDRPAEVYRLADKTLFDHIINKYMHPSKM